MAKTPIRYSTELSETICDRLAQGQSLRSICKDDCMPTEAAVRQWVTDNTDGFASRYARARDKGYDAMAEEILDLADNAERDAETPQAIHRAKLQVDTRKWLLSKMRPKVYGDRIATEVSGPDGGPVEMNDTQAAARLAALLNAAKARKDGAEDLV